MGILTDRERVLAGALGRLAYSNPFLPERIDYEREGLGEEFVHSDFVWSTRANVEGERPNILKLMQGAERLARSARAKLVAGEKAARTELELYEDAVLYLLYHRTREKLWPMFHPSLGNDAKPAGRKVEAYREFREEWQHFFFASAAQIQTRYTPEHAFAGIFQIRRAFDFIFRHIIGGSMPAARLRASIWQSVFTSDMRRYMRVLYDKMGDFTTLIVGPSGTGKELVARAIGLSRYIPFDPRTMTFAEDFSGSFHALNLSALSPTLIESELFGHKRGSFTGALADRAGWLEVCRPLGTVFLDEVGEIDAAIQVKLLRVLQTRTFQRLGDTQTRYFGGKIMAATNRDLAMEMRQGRIRDDFYYRLCSDMIRTPALRQIIEESPDELRNLVLFIAQRVTAPRGEIVDADQVAAAHGEAEVLADEVVRWVNKELGRTYPWPGNFRELEQCVRNILVRKEYRPAVLPGKGARQDLADAVVSGTLTVDQLLRRYCTAVQAQTMNYEETARRLGIDRRTVKAKVDTQMLEELRRE